MAVYIHVGQCGIQLGNSYWQKTLSNLSCLQSSSVHLSKNDFAVLAVDTDTRTFRKTAFGNQLQVPFVTGKRKLGCGSNWCYGNLEGEYMKDDIMENLRNIVENLDQFMGIIITHSLAGGTGSGLTCSVMEMLHDTYPLQYLFNAAVTPFHLGESQLENYNTLLSLPYLKEYSDCVFLFENDFIYSKTCEHKERKVTMSTLNSIISDTLYNCINPNAKLSMDLWQMSQFLSVSPYYKFIRPDCLPLDRTMFLSDYFKKRTENEQMLAVMIVSKYKLPLQDFSLFQRIEIERKIKKTFQFIPWNPFPLKFIYGTDPSLGSNNMTILTNSSDIVHFLTRIKEKAELMYKSKAYFHLYNNCIEQLECSFNMLSTLIETYTFLS